ETRGTVDEGERVSDRRSFCTAPHYLYQLAQGGWRIRRSKASQETIDDIHRHRPVQQATCPAPPIDESAGTAQRERHGETARHSLHGGPRLGGTPRRPPAPSATPAAADDESGNPLEQEPLVPAIQRPNQYAMAT